MRCTSWSKSSSNKLSIQRNSSDMIRSKKPETYTTQSQPMCQEDELFIKNYIVNTLNIYHGFSAIKMRKLIYQLANKYGKICPESWHDKKQANEDWYKSFLSRHLPLFPLKEFTNTVSNIKNNNSKNLYIFYDSLKKLFVKYSLSPQDIWNVNDMNITTVDAPTRIVDKKDDISLEILSGNCSLVTVTIAINAQGGFTPPFFIFPSNNFENFMLNDAPIGSSGTSNKTGQMKSSEFVDYLKFYRKQAKPSRFNKCLLILDSDESHFSIDCIDYCKNNDIHLLFTPPNLDKLVQPFVSSVYDIFEININHAASCWIDDNKNGDVMTVENIPSIVKQAFGKSITYSNIILGFQVAGISPFVDNKMIESMIIELDKSTSNFSKELNPKKKRKEISFTDKLEVIELECDSEDLSTSIEIIIPDIIENKIENDGDKVCKKMKKNNFDDSKCFVCHQDYVVSNPGEWWFQCQHCETWLHENCNKSNLEFICHDCAGKQSICNEKKK